MMEYMGRSCKRGWVPDTDGSGPAKGRWKRGRIRKIEKKEKEKDEEKKGNAYVFIFEHDRIVTVVGITTLDSISG